MIDGAKIIIILIIKRLYELKIVDIFNYNDNIYVGIYTK